MRPQTLVDNINDLRKQGLSWHEVGIRLGVSAEAARSAYRRSHRAGAGTSQLPDHPLSAAAPTARGTGGGVHVSASLSSDESGPHRRSGGTGAVALKSEIDLARATIAKVTRAEIRLKHSVLAEREINEVLAQRLADFDKALQQGVIPTIALTLVED